MGMGLGCVFAFAVRLGRAERRRLASAAPERAAEPPGEGDAGGRPTGAVWFFNVALTGVTVLSLFVEIVPASIVFIVASAPTLVVNYPDPVKQRERLTAHRSNAMVMVTTPVGAGVFTGILTRSGMLAAMAREIVAASPTPLLHHLPTFMGLASMPLSLVFDPDSFYFGLLPVLAQASQAVGGSAVEVGRAAILGQMTTGFPVSPLTPATFLLVGLAGVDLADHQRRTIPYAFATTVVMTLTALATRAISW